MSNFNSKIPAGPLSTKWSSYKDHIRLVNPANKRNIDIIVVGTGLAGGSASAALAELGYNVAEGREQISTNIGARGIVTKRSTK